MPTTPQSLQGEIHTITSTGNLTGYRADITGLYFELCSGQELSSRAWFHNHLMREFNRQVTLYGADTGLYFENRGAGGQIVTSAGDLTGIEALM